MLHHVQLVTVGSAAVLETVLLFAMLERRNGRYVRSWMLLLTAGTWMWHAGTFFYMLLAEAQGDIPLTARWLSMFVMTAGLLIMPSAILNGMLRLDRYGVDGPPGVQRRYAPLYLPVVMLIPAAFQLRTDSAVSYLEQVSPYVVPYQAWFVFANCLSAYGAWKLRKSVQLPRADLFFSILSLSLVLTTALTTSVVLWFMPYWPAAAPVLILLITLFPVIPAILFAYFVIRFNFLPLVLERTMFYGAIVSMLFLAHQVVLGDVHSTVSQRYKIDFTILEGIVGVMLVLAYAPLRARASEALRHLLGSRATPVRDHIRKLSVQMSEWAGQPLPQILNWFTNSIREPLRVEYVAAWLFPLNGGMIRAGDESRVPDHKAHALYQTLIQQDLHWCTLSDDAGRMMLAQLQEIEASAIARIEHQEIRGLLILGRHSWHQQLGEEELNSLILLVEQLGSTLHNSRLLAERLAAERRALQNEKLTTLGLLAGSIAHEVKNPLSSIKTITTVLAEQMQPQAEFAEDLRMILSEIDRLANTTQQLLEFSRPVTASQSHGQLQSVIQSTLRIMRHLAHQRHIRMEIDLPQDLPPVLVDEDSLREIFFNLLSNSIEAMGPGGEVRVRCHCQPGRVVAEVRDNGPGISPAVQDRLFEPFFTTKETGTGLGLYVVGRRVRESGGEIECISGLGTGTAFILRFPCGT